MSLRERLQHGWNAFMGRDPTLTVYPSYPDTYRPDHVRLSRGSERTIINSILNRIAVDVATFNIEHVQRDENKRYKESKKSSLNDCFTVNANADQTARMFLQDAAMSLLDEGSIAIVPTTATADPRFTNSYDIGSLRIGKVTQWYPQQVKVSLYNEMTGQKEERLYPKSMVALPENPFYAIMNEPNSIYRRLVEKLRMLDVIDRESSSGKLDLIIQVPYSTRSGIRKDQAEKRRAEIEQQLTGSKYGVAYIDSSEKVIQLNRAIENNLFNQVEYYTNMLLSQLGMPPSLFDGTADEMTIMNYQSRTVVPIITAIVESMHWKFLTKTARSQGQAIMFFNDPFRFTPISKLAEIANSLNRNEILTSNEIRQIIGYKPSDDPKADELKNSNLYNEADGAPPGETNKEPQEKLQEEKQKPVKQGP